jgi:Fe-S-cluster containining protein
MTLKESIIKNDDPEAIEIECRHSLERLLKEIHSPASPDDLWPVLRTHAVFQDLTGKWSSWTETDRKRCWEACCRAMERVAYQTRPYCLHCGECCRQGSPTLYVEDEPILRRGIIKRWELLTLRAGEIGFSWVTQDLVLLPEERLKVKENPGGRACLFLDSEASECLIYNDRPLQCRTMECWNPENYQGLDSRVFLSRKDLLNPDDPLVALIDTHSNRCSVSDLQQALGRIKRGFADAQDEALDILFFDQNLREYLDREQGISPENQLFLVGRPVLDLIHSFGFQIKRDAAGQLVIQSLEGEEIVGS